MVQHTIRVNKELDEKIRKYAALKQQSISNVLRELIIESLDITTQENEILKEIKSLKADVRDSHNFNKKGFDRLASLSVKNGIKIFSIWHGILIQIFLRSKDKGLDDNLCVQSKEEFTRTAKSYGINEYKNSKEEN
ncbi:DUF6290 family protein [Aliarcobacter butzleri]|uniref:DUF6290 family protein n=1 Tax=Aliarcobacter butzleri TaxID=28197 RepID=A0AAW7Q4X5_9BACT|nr:DUF6290 family protein [Aliarcobacter butzleri]MDN5114007.1 DUF6290 family protein [Aliarcobacter butzleri]